MKVLRAIFIVFLVLALAAYIAAIVLLNTQGKQLVLESIQKNYGLTATMDSLQVSFPADLHITGFSLDNIAFGDLKVRPALFRTILKGRPVIKSIEIKDLSFSFARTDNGFDFGVLQKNLSVNKPLVSLPSLSLCGYAYAAAGDSVKPFIIDHLDLVRGKVIFIDKVHGSNMRYELDNIAIALKDIVYPEFTRMEIVAGKGGSFLNGWVDAAGKNMDVALRLENIDYALVSRYLPAGWQPDQMGVNKAVFSVDVSAKAVNNDLALYSSIVLDAVEFKPESDIQDPRRMKMIKAILAMLAGNGAKPSYNFVIHTKMDDPKINGNTIKGNFLNMIDMPKLLMDTVVNTATQALSGTATNTTRITGDTLGAAMGSALGALKAVLNAGGDVLSSVTPNINATSNAAKDSSNF